MKRIGLVICLLLLGSIGAHAQKSAHSPTETVLDFYRALKAKQYLEGFHRSVYRGAVDGLTPAELNDLEKEFVRTFAAIPDKIEPRGEQITGETALVYLKFEGMKDPQPVGLIKVSGEWLVGDKETLALVKSQGRAFFFNTRIAVNEDEVYDVITRVADAEVIYSRKFQGKNATLQELISLGGAPKDLESGEASGYRFSLTLSADKTSFEVVAVPVVYDKTGRLSFYADADGVRAEDRKGQPATAKSPVYSPK